MQEETHSFLFSILSSVLSTPAVLLWVFFFFCFSSPFPPYTTPSLPSPLHSCLPSRHSISEAQIPLALHLTAIKSHYLYKGLQKVALTPMEKALTLYAFCLQAWQVGVSQQKLGSHQYKIRHRHTLTHTHTHIHTKENCLLCISLTTN